MTDRARCQSSPRVEEIGLAVSPDRLFNSLAERPGSFFLDSALPMGGLGDHSFIGFDPFLVFRACARKISITCDGQVETFTGDPLEELRKLFVRHRSAGADGLPFCGGAVGYISYELCAHLDRVPRTSPADLEIPDLEFGFYDGVLAFESVSGRVFLVANPVHRAHATEIMARLTGTLQQAVVRCQSGSPDRLDAAAGSEPRASVSKEDYLSAVRRIRDYIAAGDVYQVNLSQRYEARLPCRPYALYQRLRRRSPAPFAAYLNLGDLQTLSSSPERFLRIQGRRVETRPIKGTRPRGRTREEDSRLRAELAASEKDRAELLMIVDVERNDLGRVCEFGSIRVEDMFHLESHPTVHHLVANVEGQLRPGCDVFDCIRAMFPGGSITARRRSGPCRSLTRWKTGAVTFIRGP